LAIDYHIRGSALCYINCN